MENVRAPEGRKKPNRSGRVGERSVCHCILSLHLKSEGRDAEPIFCGRAALQGPRNESNHGSRLQPLSDFRPLPNNRESPVCSCIPERMKIKPRSGDRMQPTSQDVGGRRKLCEPQRGERNATTPTRRPGRIGGRPVCPCIPVVVNKPRKAELRIRAAHDAAQTRARLDGIRRNQDRPPAAPCPPCENRAGWGSQLYTRYRKGWASPNSRIQILR